MPDAEIYRLDQLASGPERDRILGEIDGIFFESSARQSFASEAQRAKFRERWLGRYLTHFPHFAFVARAPAGRIVGYVVGSVGDPAHDPLFADLAFFQGFGALTARYPAQLHVNLDAGWRGQGLGARLVETFADAARVAGAPGVHVVTGRGMRNAGFYERNGFAELGALDVDGRTLVFLGRAL
ncbi:MAG: GNAT family N-acetyltransferase [Hyphomicrobium sp.]|uniref:GNAT family N-acetyltransferase n=1 Tax=Hyphomicrobium sp. TaxID=82 RepID=UPI003D0C8D6C